MKRNYLVENQFGEVQTPTRKEFEAWTIRQRHEFLRHEIGKENLSLAAEGQWLYVQVFADRYTIRFKVGRKREIYSVETHDFDRCPELMGQTLLAESALQNRHN